ncbi:MAG: hypothetical protein QOI47_2527 [Actinomycetota bacterium]|nr:hypothetical protein [Actinomycetota bacterium]
MAGLWTPGGERPVDEPTSPISAQEELTPEQHELLDELQQARDQLSQAPASLIVANHAIGLFQLAAIHLDQDTPNLEEARLAIDALGALVDGLPGRLGDEEDSLREALAQLRLAFVEVSKRQ